MTPDRSEARGATWTAIWYKTIFNKPVTGRDLRDAIRAVDLPGMMSGWIPETLFRDTNILRRLRRKHGITGYRMSQYSL